MDSNRDDALKCLQIGKDALEAGDRSRALKFIAKARRLDPSLPTDDLLASLDKDKDKDVPSSSSSAPSPAPAPDRPPKSAAADEPKLRQRSKPAAASFTVEQITIVRQINGKKDYYEILGLEKSCNVDDVRKAYRKLSLRVHPDKNPAPGSEEAFKAVSKAFQCLSDDDSRKKYDLTGSEEVVHERRTTARRYQAGGGYNGYYDEFDPDEIFRQFFFGGRSPVATAQFRSFNFGGGAGRGGVQADSGGFNARALIQMLPVLLIVLFQFLPSSEPVYALSRNYPYEYKFTTERGVNYYVKSAGRFEQEYPLGSRDRIAVEGRVENEYVQVISQNCRFELQRQQWGFVRETPHCDLLRKFESGSLNEHSATAASA